MVREPELRVSDRPELVVCDRPAARGRLSAACPTAAATASACARTSRSRITCACARSELYLAYGNPNALTTVPQAIFKMIFYAGAAKGT